MTFIKGQSGNPRGRPKGIIDKRQRMQKALGEGADALLAVIKEKALEGDMQAAGLLLSRLVPTLKAEGERVQFEFDASASPAKQLEQIQQAIADAQLTVEQGKQLVEMIRTTAEIRAIEGSGDEIQKLIDAFKEIAHNLPT